MGAAGACFAQPRLPLCGRAASARRRTTAAGFYMRRRTGSAVACLVSSPATIWSLRCVRPSADGASYAKALESLGRGGLRRPGSGSAELGHVRLFSIQRHKPAALSEGEFIVGHGGGPSTVMELACSTPSDQRTQALPTDGFCRVGATAGHGRTQPSRQTRSSTHLL